MLIQDRIRTIMKSGGHTASEFADKIGVKRSNLSHVLSGRNKPSLDFLVKIINAYPKVNATWLVTGEAREESRKQEGEKLTSKSDTKVKTDLSTEKKVEKVLVFYQDGTFDSYHPNA